MGFSTADTKGTRLAAAVCAGLIALFGVLSWQNAHQMSPTYDEPMHALAGWTYLEWHDFRLNDEHPPLWKYWSALPHLFAPKLQLHSESETWQRLPVNHDLSWSWTNESLFQTPGNDGDAFVSRARAMMLLIGLGLGVFIAWWAWRLGGPVGAVAATAFFALDPNFIAHASLVTNDVTAALLFAAIVACTWRLGEEVTHRHVLGTGLLVGVAMATKLSLLVTLPVMLGLLTLRAFLPRPWSIWGRPSTGLFQRLARVGAVAAIVLLTTFVVIWASYGFRFDISPDPAVHMRVQSSLTMEKGYRWLLEHGVQTSPTQEQVAQQPLSLFTRTALLFHQWRLLPEGLLDGWIYANSRSLMRSSYLLGRVNLTGDTMFFPVAVLVKTPLATLAAAAIVLLVLLSRWRRREGLWTALCLLLPPVLYFALAMRAHLNIGLRHVFPIYPFLFVGIGWVVGQVVADRRRWAVLVAAGLGLTLSAETLSAYPYELTFFNAAAGGPRGGLALLGDSNLDWGQGLKLLAGWQAQHPQEKLYLNVYSSVDPSDYGIRAEVLPSQKLLIPREPGVLALSASVLQGIPLEASSRQLADRIRREMEPIEVLGNSVYLYRTTDIIEALQAPVTKTQ